jgi:RimJ/RimL family protein N-acetyltransferase
MSTPPFNLRPARGEDVLPYTAYLANPDVTVWLDDSAQVPIPPSRVEAILLHEAWCLWSIDRDGRFVGVTSLYSPDLRRSQARFSIVLGDPEVWGRGLGTAVTRRVVDHAFRNLGLHKVNSDYLEPNAASRAIHERVGFVEEGRLREDAWRQGRWVDRILLSLLASEWKGAAS